MRCKAPDKRFYRELTDLNGEFLGLIASHQPAHSVLGLDSAVVRRIRELSDPELDFIAETPCLLAGFSTVSSTRMVGEANLDLADVDRGWVDAARLFTAGLMTYLWQMAGRDSFTAALCVGPERSRMTEFTNGGCVGTPLVCDYRPRSEALSLQ